MEGVLGTRIISTGLPDVFADDSENDRTFYGFSDSEANDLCDKDSSQGDEAEAEPVGPSIQEERRFRRPAAHPFELKVILRSRPSTRSSTEDEVSRVKKERHERLVEDERAVKQPSPSVESDSEEDVSQSFLSKREENIRANKAMLAELMADLQKMPGGGMLLKSQAPRPRPSKRKRSSGSPRSETTWRESRRAPERATRRQTRSMSRAEGSPATQEAEIEFSLEKELLEVRRAPRSRGARRPSQGIPHVVRRVEEITEEELQLVADNLTEKVYNKLTGSTCHQCRQKTMDTKTSCRSEDCRGIQGQFCGPCLRNRYGEDVCEALLDPGWRCPPCRRICNCSFCRQREGRCPTGILFPLAQNHGFSNVHSYLSSLRNKQD